MMYMLNIQYWEFFGVPTSLLRGSINEVRLYYDHVHVNAETTGDPSTDDAVKLIS